MSFVMPEIVMQKVLDYGIKQLRQNKEEFYDLFSQYTQDELNADYGEKYLEDIWKWFTTTKIPVVKAWNFNRQNIPSISVHLANETEDESKASLQDIGGIGEDGEIGMGVFTVMIDIGIHANKAGDHVLWLYYIVAYILFKHKGMAEKFGLRLHTFSASDYNKDANKMTENIWTRWVRFRCTTQNFIPAITKCLQIDDVNTDAGTLTEPMIDYAADDPSLVDPKYNKGVWASQVGDEEDEEDVLI